MYLHRRGAVYYYRRPIRQEHIGLWLGPSGKPRREWSVSLRTKDRATAIDRMDEAARLYREELAARLHETKVAPKPNDTPIRHPEAFMSREQFEHFLEDMEHQGRENAEEEWAMENDPLWEAKRALAEERAELRSQRQGQELLREIRAEEQVAASVPLMELFEGYAVESGARPATIVGFRSYVRSFIAHCGFDDARKVELRHVIAWIEWLRKQPGRRGNRLSEKTIRTSYLAALRLTLAFGVSKLLLPVNVTRDLKLMKAKGSRQIRERHFSDQEQRALLQASLKQPIGRHSQHVADARRWVPWLCAYTGARVGEVLQLRKFDVRKEDGIWAVHLTPMAGEVKTNEQRWVPLHEHLIAQGFCEWASELERERLFYIEREKASPTRISPPYQSVYNRLREWIREHVQDPDVQPCHAWRHTFKTLGREYDMDGEIVDAIQGHRPATVGKTYGAISLKAKLRELQKLPRFEVAA